MPLENLMLACGLLLALNARAQSDDLNTPWKDSSKAIIIDPYAKNNMDWAKIQTDKRVVAIIHKASEGNKSDIKYEKRKLLAQQYGFLWGSYHLGLSGDSIEQAEYYLKIVGNDSNQVYALDLESLDASHMSLKNAEEFIKHIYERIGRYPLIYCNKNVFDAINANYSDESIFAKCGLWYARFRSNIPDFNKKIWDTYTVWQFSCEINCKQESDCLYNVPGTKRDMDVNIYNGTIKELKAIWPDIFK